MSQPDLITLTDPRSPASEAYRTLRTNLEFSSLDHPLHSLLVTSPAANVDKSQILANLAVIMAEGGRQVILVDADLRRPALHEIFGLANDKGLSDLIRADNDSIDLPLQAAGVTSLQVITSGHLPQNPSILIGSPKMTELIATLTEQADLVLFDAPPVIAVTDAALLAAKVDGTVLVIRAGSTQRDHVVRARTLLEKVNARLVGAALTNASLDSGVSGYYR
jgi:capsular exopolysaccharide synthesis family protein